MGVNAERGEGPRGGVKAMPRRYDRIWVGPQSRVWLEEMVAKTDAGERPILRLGKRPETARRVKVTAAMVYDEADGLGNIGFITVDRKVEPSR